MILNTNAVSAVLDGDPDIQPIAASTGPFLLPAIVIGEYWFGLLELQRSVGHWSLSFKGLSRSVRFLMLIIEPARFMRISASS